MNIKSEKNEQFIYYRGFQQQSLLRPGSAQPRKNGNTPFVVQKNYANQTQIQKDMNNCLQKDLELQKAKMDFFLDCQKQQNETEKQLLKENFEMSKKQLNDITLKQFELCQKQFDKMVENMQEKNKQSKQEIQILHQEEIQKYKNKIKVLENKIIEMNQQQQIELAILKESNLKNEHLTKELQNQIQKYKTKLQFKEKKFKNDIDKIKLKAEQQRDIDQKLVFDKLFEEYNTQIKELQEQINKYEQLKLTEKQLIFDCKLQQQKNIHETDKKIIQPQIQQQQLFHDYDYNQCIQPLLTNIDQQQQNQDSFQQLQQIINKNDQQQQQIYDSDNFQQFQQKINNNEQFQQQIYDNDNIQKSQNIKYNNNHQQQQQQIQNQQNDSYKKKECDEKTSELQKQFYDKSVQTDFDQLVLENQTMKIDQDIEKKLFKQLQRIHEKIQLNSEKIKCRNQNVIKHFSEVKIAFELIQLKN